MRAHVVEVAEKNFEASLLRALIPLWMLADPILELHNGTGALIAENDNWQDDPAQVPVLTELGLAPTSPNESALLQSLPVGTYTAVLTGASGGTGTGLVEVYNVDHSVPVTNNRLANISTRGFVLTDNDVMIGGFILGGGSHTNIAIRGIGPSLAQIGVSPALVDPTLELHDANGALLIGNNNWQDDPEMAGQLAANGLGLPDPNESGIFVSLQPGLYTAVLAGNEGGTGIGLIEIYNLQ